MKFIINQITPASCYFIALPSGDSVTTQQLVLRKFVMW